MHSRTRAAICLSALLLTAMYSLPLSADTGSVTTSPPNPHQLFSMRRNLANGEYRDAIGDNWFYANEQPALEVNADWSAYWIDKNAPKGMPKSLPVAVGQYLARIEKKKVMQTNVSIAGKGPNGGPLILEENAQLVLCPPQVDGALFDINTCAYPRLYRIRTVIFGLNNEISDATIQLSYSRANAGVFDWLSDTVVIDATSIDRGVAANQRRIEAAHQAWQDSDLAFTRNQRAFKEEAGRLQTQADDAVLRAAKGAVIFCTSTQVVGESVNARAYSCDAPSGLKGQFVLGNLLSHGWKIESQSNSQSASEPIERGTQMVQVVSIVMRKEAN